MKPLPILFPLSFLYGMVVWLRNLFFDIGILPVTDVGVPVISIGNITAGGSGKTPVTIETARFLTSIGKRTAVISRGYGRSTRGLVIVSDGNNILTDAVGGGDEPVLIASQVKNAVVIVDEDRVRGAQYAVRTFGVDCIVLDDGFQHRYLKRICDIVLMDSSRSPFETMMLPAGYRREQLKSVRRANAVIATKVRDSDNANALLTGIDHTKNIFTSTYKPAGIKNIFTGVSQSLDTLNGRPVVAVSGIANTNEFHRDLKQIGSNVMSDFSYSDHHRYSRDNIDDVVAMFREKKAEYIVTTEKDAVKLRNFRGELMSIPILSLTMCVRFFPEAQWRRMLTEAVS